MVDPECEGTPQLICPQVVKGDKEAEKNLPKVMKDEIKSNSSGSKRPFSTMAYRSFSTSQRPRSVEGAFSSIVQPEIPPVLAPNSSPEALRDEAIRQQALAFVRTVTMKQRKIPGSNVKERYIDIVDQVTNLLMRHGQKAKAQRVCSGRFIAKKNLIVTARYNST